MAKLRSAMSAQELAAIGRWQRCLLLSFALCIAAWMLGLANPQHPGYGFFWLSYGILAIPAWFLLRRLGRGFFRSGLLSAGCLVPFVGLFIAIEINYHATETLRCHGRRVGFWGLKGAAS